MAYAKPISERTKLTPPQIAGLWGVSTEKVLVWITTGQLRAIDAASRRGERPRYLVDLKDLEAFERSRAVTPPTQPAPRRKRSAGVATKEFF